MIEQPELLISDFRAAGSDIITIHAEAARHLHRIIHQIKEAGAMAGVALNPATPLCSIENILPDIDMIVIMTVNPGFGGQKFIPTMLEKIAETRKLLNPLSQRVLLEVDGGINLENAQRVASAGADVLVAGAAVFKSSNYALTIKGLKKASCARKSTSLK